MYCKGCKFLNTIVTGNISWISCAIGSGFFWDSAKNNMVCTGYLSENTENGEEEML
jgi:hypothetical protein